MGKILRIALVVLAAALPACTAAAPPAPSCLIYEQKPDGTLSCAMDRRPGAEPEAIDPWGQP